jgi:hypothetical protein
MIRQIVYKATFFLLPVLFAVVATAQSGITVSATADRNRILIGEPIVLILKADIPENEAISFFSIDSIQHFEFLEKQKIDTANTSSGTLLTQVIRITSFDSGHWVIPSFLLTENTMTDSIPVDVGFSEFDRNQDYHDIKDVVDVEVKKEKETWWWYVAGAGLLILLVILYFILRKKPKASQVKTETPINPYEDAMRQLAVLQTDRGEAKQYYSLLADIFRQYVSRRKGINSLQKTTDDLILQLKGITIDKNIFDGFVQALRMSDFVKFAKYQPSDDDKKTSWQAIKTAITAIEETEPAISTRETPRHSTETAVIKNERNLKDASKELMDHLIYAMNYAIDQKKEGGSMMPFAVVVTGSKKIIQAYPEGNDYGMKIFEKTIRQEHPDFVVYAGDGSLTVEGKEWAAVLFKAYDKNDSVMYRVAQRYTPKTATREFEKNGNPVFIGTEKNFS